MSDRVTSLIASAKHVGITWYIQQDRDGRFVTLVGWVGSAPLFLQTDAPGVSALSVPGMVEAEIAAVRKRSSKQTQREAVF